MFNSFVRRVSASGIRLTRTDFWSEGNARACNIAIGIIQSARYSTKEHITPRKEKVKVGVLGCGRIAYLHVQNILNTRGVDLQWVADTDTLKSEELKHHFYLDHLKSSSPDQIDKLLSDPKLDAVFVLSSTESHTQYCCQILQKGKAVFVEKPAGESLSDIKLCYETAETYNVPLLTGFNRRFDPTLSHLWSSYHNGAIGQPALVKLTSRDCPKPSYDFLKTCDNTGCNIISDMAIHDIDTLVWLTKAEVPESVVVQTHAHDPVMREHGVDDTVMMMIKYRSGLIASIDVVRDSVYGYDVRVELFGSKGQLTADPSRQTSLRHDQMDNCTTATLKYSFNDRFEQAYQNELHHFIRCVQGEETPLVTKEESLVTGQIVAMGIESWKKKTIMYF